MKKSLVLGGIVVVAVGVAVWLLVFRKANRFEVGQGVPADAVFVVETPSFNSIRDKLYRNKIWASLKEYPYFEAYHANLERVDSLCEAYPGVRRLLTDRPFAVSCHLVSGTAYDFLYVCDLGKLNVVQAFDGLAGSLMKEGQVVKKGEVTEVAVEDMKLYYAIRENLLLASFSESLVRQSIEACKHPGDIDLPAGSGDVALRVNHKQLGKLMGAMTGGEGADSSALETTVLALELKDKALYFKGETHPNPNYFSLLSALSLIDGNRSQVKEIVGSHVAAYVSLCYRSFDELEGILLENYKAANLKEYQEYERALNRMNKFLGVDVGELFTSWIGTEIAVVKPAVDKENRLDNLVLAVRSKDIDLAHDQLEYLKEQINSRTPVRFREMEYNGHTISYLSLKGFFNLFLGPMFKRFDKPYYTLVGDYVVFSNSASTLATMIKDYSLGNTLARDAKYAALMDELGDGNNVYGYVSSPEAYEYLYESLQAGTRAELMKNKGAFQSFESVGFAMANAAGGYETRMIASHNVNAAEDYEVRALSRELEGLADEVESGYYNVVVPDSIAVSTRGDYAYATELLSYSGRLSNGDPDGIWTISDGRGRMLAQYVYREGKPDGEARFLYPGGAVEAQVVYDRGKIKAYKEFFGDGTLKMELEYNKGVRHGDARMYYSTGHLLGEGKYRRGRRTGTWKYYKVTGELERKMKY